MHKPFSILLTIVLLVACNSSTKKGSDSFEIKNAQALATKMMSAADPAQRNSQNYFQGKLKTMTVLGRGVVTGLFSPATGKYERFFWLQTTSNYDLYEEIENGQVLYANNCFIINDANSDIIRFYTIDPEDEKVVAVLEKMPKSLTTKLQANYVIGTSVGTGTGKVNMFWGMFNTMN